MMVEAQSEADCVVLSFVLVPIFYLRELGGLQRDCAIIIWFGKDLVYRIALEQTILLDPSSQTPKTNKGELC